MSKIVLFANTDWYLYNFRRSLALALREAGHELLLLSPPGEYGARLRALGLRWEPVPMDRRSLNPLREAAVLAHLWRLFRRERPDLVHGFTIKCAVYGSLAARLAGVPARVNAVTGMGYVFTSTDAKARALRPLVRLLMRAALDGRDARLILQNPDDVAVFEQARLVAPGQIRLIPGSGVDCVRFAPGGPGRARGDVGDVGGGRRGRGPDLRETPHPDVRGHAPNTSVGHVGPTYDTIATVGRGHYDTIATVGRGHYDTIATVGRGHAPDVRGHAPDIDTPTHPVGRGHPPDNAAAPPPFRVLLAARLLWDKGLAEFIDAARRLHGEGRAIDFLLAGDPDPGNPAAVPEATVNGWVDEGLLQWLGHVDDMPALLRSVDVAVLPSYREGLPKGLIEAAACGLPLVTTDVPGCREVVADGIDGLRVPVRDAAALAAAIARLHDDPALASRLGAAARTRALAEFDEQIVIARTLAVYREVLPGDR